MLVVTELTKSSNCIFLLATDKSSYCSSTILHLTEENKEINNEADLD